MKEIPRTPEDADVIELQAREIGRLRQLLYAIQRELNGTGYISDATADAVDAALETRKRYDEKRSPPRPE